MLNYVAKKASVPGPLVAVCRGYFLSHFSNQGKYKMYFSQEQKQTVLRAFSLLSGTSELETEFNLGLFLCISVPPPDDYVRVTLNTKSVLLIKSELIL